LNWHEIVNDTIAGEPIAITFCPLCGSSLAFRREVNGQATTFGVSGKLFNSNLIMYNRIDDTQQSQQSYWQQETGQAIIGPAATRGEELEFVVMSSTTWQNWKELHPQTEVLSRDTGFDSYQAANRYDQYPYGTYEQDGELYFGIENEDTRLPLKEPGFGFTLEGESKFYTTESLQNQVTIQDTLAGIEVEVQYNNGAVIMTVKDNLEQIVPIGTFWFAFAAFHPNTQIYNN
jgi:hypothetical protein